MPTNALFAILWSLLIGSVVNALTLQIAKSAIVNNAFCTRTELDFNCIAHAMFNAFATVFCRKKRVLLAAHVKRSSTFCTTSYCSCEQAAQYIQMRLLGPPVLSVPVNVLLR